MIASKLDELKIKWDTLLFLIERCFRQYQLKSKQTRAFLAIFFLISFIKKRAFLAYICYCFMFEEKLYYNRKVQKFSFPKIYNMLQFPWHLPYAISDLKHAKPTLRQRCYARCFDFITNKVVTWQWSINYHSQTILQNINQWQGEFINRWS